MEPIKMSPESIKKVEAILKKARYELGMVLVKGWFITVGSVVPIAAISVAAGLMQTAFPMLAGLMTALLINFRYIVPQSKEIGEKYGKEIKDVVEEEKRRQTEGS